jgi:hypothetical protein
MDGNRARASSRPPRLLAPSSRRRRSAATATDVPQSLFGAWDWANFQTTLGAVMAVCVATFFAGILTAESPVQNAPLMFPIGLFASLAPAPPRTAPAMPVPAASGDAATLGVVLDALSALANWLPMSAAPLTSAVRCVIASVACGTHGELTLFMAVMLVASVDVERVLGSTKLREAIIRLGLQRILLQAALNFLIGFASALIWSHASPSPAAAARAAAATAAAGGNASPAARHVTLAEAAALASASMWAMAPSAAWMAVTLCLIRRILVPARRSFRLAGLPLSEQTVGDVFALQLALSSPDRLCIVTSAILALLNCSPWLPIHVPSTLLLPRLWENDADVAGATVLARFLPPSGAADS